MTHQLAELAEPASPLIPLSLLTGFLGSGKTTVLNHLVAQPELADALVIINEFGEMALDHLLVAHSAENLVMEMSSGCLCCSSASPGSRCCVRPAGGPAPSRRTR